MMPARLLLAQAAPAADPAFMLLLQMAMIVGIFYLIWFRPMRQRQKKLEDQIKSLKPGDKVILNAGIFAQIVSVEDDAFQVRVDDKTRLKVLKNAIAGLQGQPTETTEKK
jgi:preprotein translocase subunit YajC